MCDLKYNRIDKWTAFEIFISLNSLESVSIEGNPVISSSNDAKKIGLLIYYPQSGLLSIDEKSKKKYEREKQSKSCCKLDDDDDQSDYSDLDKAEKNSEESCKLDTNKSQDTSAISAMPLPGKCIKKQMTFKLDVSKCAFDTSKEAGAEHEMSIQSIN